MRLLTFAGLAVPLGLPLIAHAQTPPDDARTPPNLSLAFDVGHWKGISKPKDGTATLSASGAAIFRHIDGRAGWTNHGFRRENDGTLNASAYYGLRFDVQLPTDDPLKLETRISLPPQPTGEDFVSHSTATIALRGKGWHTVTLPWGAFDFQQAQPAFLRYIKEIQVEADYGNGPPHGPVALRNVALIRGESVALTSEVRGQAAPAGGRVSYEVGVENCSSKPQLVRLQLQKHGWEQMVAKVAPATLQLAPGERQFTRVIVDVSQRVPAGGREVQTLQAVADGEANKAATMQFVTASQLPSPNILHTQASWDEVRANVTHYEWAKKSSADYLKRADAWRVPDIARAPNNLTGTDNMGPYLFRTAEENSLMASGIAYQLSGDKKYAEKVALFLLRLSDPKEGYPVTLRAVNQSFVQEGHFFQHVAMAYDMVLPAGILMDSDRAQIAATLRTFCESVRMDCEKGAISNWNVSEVTGALYCALTVQDLSLADRFLNGPSGILDQMSKGIMDDGWWYECSISYNTWVAEEFSQIALAMEPWGLNLKDARVPAAYTSTYSLVPLTSHAGLYGMNFEKFGPVRRPYVDLKRMWDALPVFANYKGTIFGINDSGERDLTGYRSEAGAQPYELAYYLYRDPQYLRFIPIGSRDLLYGVPELPATAPDTSGQSAYAENVGIAMLRSQTVNRPASDQIQAVLHYGTHGGFHGHFDRTNLLSLMRYGKSFYNPEMIWYGYGSFMYKFYVQSSMSKNMVVVDQKMQEPVESPQLLFHSGPMMQAVVVESRARWSHEPYGGMKYPEQGYASFAFKAFGEGRSLPIPANPPETGDMTGFTEPILQRRAMIVTDDYVVLADYLKGEAEHTYDNLLQIRGFRSLDGEGKTLVRHDAQMSNDPVRAAQFITDVDWYSVHGSALARFEDPAFKLDVRSLWPQEQLIMVANAPDVQKEEKQLSYAVRGDGKELGSGRLGAWLASDASVDIELQDVKNLELETRVVKSLKPSVFWGNARITLRDGTDVPLSALPTKTENVQMPNVPGGDYFGGPVKIKGLPYDQATPGQPQNDKAAAITRVDLSGLDAVRFRATLGSDYPLGDESLMRKTYGSRTTGKSACFLTLIEPYDHTNKVKNAMATGPDRLRVELVDGRIQDISIKNLDGDATSIGVSISESQNEKLIRSETTKESVGMAAQFPQSHP